MPCYNESSRIAEGVRSVFNQTFPSLELIIVDDGSKDDSLSAENMMDYVSFPNPIKVPVPQETGV